MFSDWYDFPACWSDLRGKCAASRKSENVSYHCRGPDGDTHHHHHHPQHHHHYSSRACLAVRIRKGTESGLHYYPSWFRLAKCCQYGVWLETGCMCQRLMRVQRQKVPTWHICQKSKMRMKNGRRSSFTVWLKGADDMLRGKTLYPWRDKNVWQLEIDYASTNIYPMLNLVLKFSNGLDCSPIIRNNMKNDCPGVVTNKEKN